MESNCIEWCARLEYFWNFIFFSAWHRISHFSCVREPNAITHSQPVEHMDCTHTYSYLPVTCCMWECGRSRYKTSRTAYCRTERISSPCSKKNVIVIHLCRCCSVSQIFGTFCCACRFICCARLFGCSVYGIAAIRLTPVLLTNK